MTLMCTSLDPKGCCAWGRTKFRCLTWTTYINGQPHSGGRKSKVGNNRGQNTQGWTVNLLGIDLNIYLYLFNWDTSKYLKIPNLNTQVMVLLWLTSMYVYTQKYRQDGLQTIVRYNYILNRMVSYKNTDNTKYWWRCRRIRFSVNVKWYCLFQ